MHVYGTGERIFINATLGCKSKCSYCYLPSLGYKLGSNELDVLGKSELVKLVDDFPGFTAGRYGTVISLGCYSECWDSAVKQVTIDLVIHFLQLGNPVQFSSKCLILPDDLKDIADKVTWKGQLCIFISSATLTSWHRVERGTAEPNIRFQSFFSAANFDIPVYLYIKPVIAGVTINDFDLYMDLFRDYPISGVVVGTRFVRKGVRDDSVCAPIGNGELMCLNEGNDDEEVLFKLFRERLDNVYQQSLIVVEYWRWTNA